MIQYTTSTTFVIRGAGGSGCVSWWVLDSRDGERREFAGAAGATASDGAAAASAAATRASSMVLSTSSFMRACQGKG